jgi:hypothetical protein
MSLVSRVTLDVPIALGHRVDGAARRRRMQAADVLDAAISRAIEVDAAPVLARVAAETAEALRLRGLSLPPKGWPAHVVRQHVDVPRIVGMLDVLVRDGGGWAWRRAGR